jgi:hypothetical protein
MGIRPIKFEMEIPWEGVNFTFQGSTDTRKGQAFSQKGVQGCNLSTPKFGGGGGKLFSIISVLSILIYLKRNSFNSHYYYTFDILINLMVYLAE